MLVHLTMLIIKRMHEKLKCELRTTIENGVLFSSLYKYKKMRSSYTPDCGRSLPFHSFPFCCPVNSILPPFSILLPPSYISLHLYLTFAYVDVFLLRSGLQTFLFLRLPACFFVFLLFSTSKMNMLK